MTTSLDQLRPLTIEQTGEYLKKKLDQGGLRVSELVNSILQKGVMVRASDIHFEPTRYGVRVRFRVDGMFQDLATFSGDMHDQVVARVKVMADLISHKREVTQEGRIGLTSFEGEGNSSDLRVSVVPTVMGEKVVIRMFNPIQGLFDVERLGYTPDMTAKLEEMLFGLQGMILLAGPSGSGKTTTLYACLQKIYLEKDQYASIITIEDPVEYEFGQWAQMQVNKQHGIDFASGLAAVLRQDPEVIMVGEIRDTETCEVALRAGLTGHMVLSTIHSGSACEVVTRILNMGMEPFVVASALTGVVAQRLVRKVCSGCAEAVRPEAAEIEFVERTLGRTDFEFMDGPGCRDCNFTGYAGRTPIAEILSFDEGLRSLILESPSTGTLKKFSTSRGMRTLLEDGLLRVVDGKTTLAEVLRVVSLRRED